LEVRISHVDGVKFAIQARSHVVVCDQPVENHGSDTGMTPPEFLLASLGSCAAYYAMEFLKTRGLAETGVEVTVTAEKLLQPARLGNFRVEISCPVALTAEQNATMIRAVERCVVHNTLQSTPQIAIEVTTAT
jgi:putative redox protein